MTDTTNAVANTVTTNATSNSVVTNVESDVKDYVWKEYNKADTWIKNEETAVKNDLIVIPWYIKLAICAGMVLVPVLIWKIFF